MPAPKHPVGVWFSEGLGFSGKKLQTALKICENELIENVAEIRAEYAKGKLEALFPQAGLRTRIEDALAADASSGSGGGSDGVAEVKAEKKVKKSKKEKKAKREESAAADEGEQKERKQNKKEKKKRKSAEDGSDDSDGAEAPAPKKKKKKSSKKATDDEDFFGGMSAAAAAPKAAAAPPPAAPAAAAPALAPAAPAVVGGKYETKQAEMNAVAYRKQHHITVTDGHHSVAAPPPMARFADAHGSFTPTMLQALRAANFTEPTPIQAQSWPIALAGHDMVSVAETGSGKTCAFLLPGFMHIMKQAHVPVVPGGGPVMVVLAPTRELALQVGAGLTTERPLAGWLAGSLVVQYLCPIAESEGITLPHLTGTSAPVAAPTAPGPQIFEQAKLFGRTSKVRCRLHVLRVARWCVVSHGLVVWLSGCLVRRHPRCAPSACTAARPNTRRSGRWSSAASWSWPRQGGCPTSRRWASAAWSASASWCWTRPTACSTWASSRR
jgi:hypothetical protein